MRDAGHPDLESRKESLLALMLEAERERAVNMDALARLVAEVTPEAAPSGADIEEPS